MGGILPIRRKTQDNQQSYTDEKKLNQTNVNTTLAELHSNTCQCKTMKSSCLFTFYMSEHWTPYLEIRYDTSM